MNLAPNDGRRMNPRAVTSIVIAVPSDLTKIRAGNSDVLRKEDTNPEGKGLSGFLLDWQQTEPRAVVAKPRRQVLAEYFTSMLILSAAFSYKPSIGTRNYLYLVDGEWSLSLIDPDEWSNERRNGFVGTCILQRDMTWTIQPSERIADDRVLSEALARFYDGFAASLETDQTIEEILPFYAGQFRYYQRLFASALSRSIRASVTLSGERSTPCREWRVLLPSLENVLLTRKG